MRSFLSLTLLLAASGLAAAQVRPFSGELELYAGAWEGDDVLDNATLLGARGLFNLNRVLAVEATYGAVLTAQEGADKTLNQFGLGALLHLGWGAFSPFIVGGIGAVDKDLAYNAGLGGIYYINDMIGLRGDARGWFSPDAPAADTYAHLAVSLGVQIQLGGERDIDKDGVENGVDKCPVEAEDKDQFEDGDGCPDEDNDADGLKDGEDKCPNEAEDKDGDRDDDGCPDLDDDNDGVQNEQDKCPNEAEDKDGFQDEDGCPDLDNDNDGIPDTQDTCPTAAESKNGFEDEDGCPEIDTDGDKIYDSQDKCKTDAETRNGFQDQDGCPDAYPEQLQSALGFNRAYNFAKGRDKLPPTARKLLLGLAEVLKLDPTLKIKIIGGAQKGKDAEALGLKRAEAAKALLVEQGAKAEQIQATSIGDAPLSADAPKEVRADRLEISVETPEG
ncbi:thrombospondin type 3 repeat-containing protein [Myxococcota bacterium]|nr:thrombospondin type 3 repeat-containing protein [Myxococcota bacterium]MBU1896984.1 thrombospondin type 3 repeat-containing protein [Myxococcota bacterium]